MKILCLIFSFYTFTQFSSCRDFYIGMFKRDNFLVAQDTLFKAASPVGYTIASYGRLFKCPITFLRVVDRLGIGRGPTTSVVRGGLGKQYINLRIKSTYKLPISVNVYVGCDNKHPYVVTFPSRATKASLSSKRDDTITTSAGQLEMTNTSNNTSDNTTTTTPLTTPTTTTTTTKSPLPKL